ncbi:hypothetical protein ACQEVX_10230 [Streptomyces syringium]
MRKTMRRSCAELCVRAVRESRADVRERVGEQGYERKWYELLNARSRDR